MCVVCMVFDHFKQPFEPYIPYIPSDPVPLQPQPLLPFPVQPVVPPQIPPAQWADLGEVIRQFREALGAARVVDRLTGKPDCEDPEKAALLRKVELLEERVRQLEAEKAQASPP